MEQRERWSLTPEQHRELWQRWKAGESLSDIGRALGRVRSGIHHWLATRGGIAPAVRRRSARTLSLAEREAISRGLAAGRSVRRIAEDLGRSPSIRSSSFCASRAHADLISRHLCAQSTRARRDCRVNRSVYGNGTLTTSPWLKVAIRLAVGGRVPLAERPEWVIALGDVAGLRKNHPLCANLIDELVALFELKGHTYGLRNSCLCVASQLAGDHEILPGKEIPCCMECPY
jgi:hypothetical protein